MPSRDTSPPPASKINALPPLMSHIDCLSLLLLLSIINKINIPTNLPIITVIFLLYEKWSISQILQEIRFI